MGAMLVRHEPSCVADVRREIALDLGQNGVADDSTDDITLVASELVGNAVRHAHLSPDGDLDVAWTINPRSVLISVSDGDTENPQLRIAATDQPSGRGLAIVDALSTAWGVERLANGKRVWARIPRN